MLTLTLRTLCPLVADTSNRLDVALPEPVAAARLTAETLRQAGRDLIPTNGVDIAAAVADALLAGKDPLSSKEVQRALVAQQLRSCNVDNLLSDHADRLAAAAVLEHADAVIETWRPAVAEAEEHLREFRALAPGADLHDDSLTSTLPPHAMTPWARAREAVQTVDRVAQGWQALAAAGAAQIPLGGRPLIFADLDLDQVTQLGRDAAAADVTRLDVPLDLADTATYAQRADRITREREASQSWDRTTPEREREKRRETFGIRIPGGALS